MKIDVATATASLRRRLPTELVASLQTLLNRKSLETRQAPAAKSGCVELEQLVIDGMPELLQSISNLQVR